MPKRNSDQIVKLGQVGLEYLSYKKTEKTTKEKIVVLKQNIEELMLDVPLIDNGEHKEITVVIEDSIKILFRKQAAVSVRLIDNILDLVKEKFKSEQIRRRFILTTEVLAPNAVEQMFSEGLITQEELRSWIIESKQYSLIVKTVK
jgi:hypothetical protein